jgi:hypothetical protein
MTNTCPEFDVVEDPSARKWYTNVNHTHSNKSEPVGWDDILTSLTSQLNSPRKCKTQKDNTPPDYTALGTSAVTSVTQSGGMDNVISVPIADCTWVNMPLYDNPAYEDAMRIMCGTPKAMDVPSLTPIQKSTLNPNAPPFVPGTGVYGSTLDDPLLNQWTSCGTSINQWTSCGPSWTATCDLLANSNYSIPGLDDAMWEELNEAPPTTFEEGVCEAHTLAGWGTIPYTIVNGMFCSEHSYPVVINTDITGYENTSVIGSKYSTLFKVESDDPFVMYIGWCRLNSVTTELPDNSTVETLCFPHGLPLFKLRNARIVCNRRDNPYDHTISMPVTFYGEVYDMETVFSVIPANVQIPVNARGTKTLEIRDDGRLYTVGSVNIEESGEIKEESEDSEDSEDDSKESKEESEESEESEDSEDSEDSEESQKIAEDEVRKYYSSMSLHNFMKLDKDVQEAVFTIFDQPIHNKLATVANKITNFGRLLETWVHQNKTAESCTKGDLHFYKTAILECFDMMFVALE